jgi:hypothetical protein
MSGSQAGSSGGSSVNVAAALSHSIKYLAVTRRKSHLQQCSGKSVCLCQEIIHELGPNSHRQMPGLDMQTGTDNVVFSVGANLGYGENPAVALDANVPVIDL